MDTTHRSPQNDNSSSGNPTEQQPGILEEDHSTHQPPLAVEDLHLGNLSLSSEESENANDECFSRFEQHGNEDRDNPSSSSATTLAQPSPSFQRPLPPPNPVRLPNGEIDLDSIIDRLLELRGGRPGTQVQLHEYEIRFLCTKSRDLFISQPILLELEAPIKVRS